MTTTGNTVFSHLKFPEFPQNDQQSELLEEVELSFATTGSEFWDKEQELLHVWSKQHESDNKREHRT